MSGGNIQQPNQQTGQTIRQHPDIREILEEIRGIAKDNTSNHLALSTKLAEITQQQNFVKERYEEVVKKLASFDEKARMLERNLDEMKGLFDNFETYGKENRARVIKLEDTTSRIKDESIKVDVKAIKEEEAERARNEQLRGIFKWILSIITAIIIAVIMLLVNSVVKKQNENSITREDLMRMLEDRGNNTNGAYTNGE